MNKRKTRKKAQQKILNVTESTDSRERTQKHARKTFVIEKFWFSPWEKKYMRKNIAFGETRANGLKRKEKRKMNQLCRYKHRCTKANGENGITQK